MANQKTILESLMRKCTGETVEISRDELANYKDKARKWDEYLYGAEKQRALTGQLSAEKDREIQTLRDEVQATRQKLAEYNSALISQRARFDREREQMHRRINELKRQYENRRDFFEFQQYERYSTLRVTSARVRGTYPKTTRTTKATRTGAGRD